MMRQRASTGSGVEVAQWLVAMSKVFSTALFGLIGKLSSQPASLVLKLWILQFITNLCAHLGEPWHDFSRCVLLSWLAPRTLLCSADPALLCSADESPCRMPSETDLPPLL